MGELADELRSFMAAISGVESGGRYHIKGPHTKYGRPLGKYQILDSNWDAWAAEAGIPGADWRSPQAQERVAATKFLQYYEAFNGRWDAVAVGWFAGPGRARKYLQNPDSVANLADVLGTNVATYVRKVMGNMQNGLGRPPMERAPVAAPAIGAEYEMSPKDKMDSAMSGFRSFITGGDQASERSYTSTPGVGAEATTEDLQQLPFDQLDINAVVNPEQAAAKPVADKPGVNREAII